MDQQWLRSCTDSGSQAPRPYYTIIMTRQGHARCSGVVSFVALVSWLQVAAMPHQEFGWLWCGYVGAMAACLLDLRTAGSQGAADRLVSSAAPLQTYGTPCGTSLTWLQTSSLLVLTHPACLPDHEVSRSRGRCQAQRAALCVRLATRNAWHGTVAAGQGLLTDNAMRLVVHQAFGLSKP